MTADMTASARTGSQASPQQLSAQPGAASQGKWHMATQLLDSPYSGRGELLGLSPQMATDLVTVFCCV